MSEKKNDSKLPENMPVIADANASDFEKEKKLQMLRKKLAKQQEILNSAAEKSYG